MPSPSRSPEQIRHHFEVEKELAARLRASSQEERTQLFKTLYDELFERVPDHPRLTRRQTPEQSQANVEKQFKLVSPHLQPGMTFLEFAPGDCRLSQKAANHCTKVIGVDISDQRSPDETFPDNFELIVYDGYKLDQVADASVDIMFSYQFLEHLHPDDVPLHFDLAWRILKPGGLYILATPHLFTGPHDVSRFFGNNLECFHFQEWSYRKMRKILSLHRMGNSFIYRFGKAVKSQAANKFWLFLEFIIGLFPQPIRKLLSKRLFRSVTLIAIKDPILSTSHSSEGN